MAAVDRLHGKGGEVHMSPTGVSGVLSVHVASLNKWDLDMSKDHVKVTCFGDTNQVYVDGLPDIKGNLGGFYDPVDGLGLFAVFGGAVAPWLDLFPNIATPLLKFSGRALLDGKISVDANGAITIGGGFVAAGPWTMPA